MPKEVLTLNDFSGGLNSVKDPRDIKLNELAVAKNIMVDEQGAVRTPGTMEAHGVIDSQAATLVGGYGLAVLESDYEQAPISVTGISNLDFSYTNAVSGYINMETTISSFADAGGGKVTVTTSANHGYSSTHLVNISHTTNYNGDSYALSNITANTFDIVHSWDGNDATGRSRLDWSSIFRVGQQIRAKGSTNNDAFYLIRSFSSSLGMSVNPTLTGESNTSATIKLMKDSDVFVVLSDADNNKVDIYSKNADERSETAWTSSKINIVGTNVPQYTAGKIVYYAIDGAIRASDAEFDNASRIRWYGFINRTHFQDAQAKDQYFDFYEKDNKLTAPTDCQIGNTYPTANVGFDLDIATPANSDSEWEAATYEVAISFIYDGNQESLLYKSADTFTVADGDSVTISVHAKTDATGYNPRISGARAYTRISGSDDAWILLCDIDMRRGGRATLDGTYSAWADGATPATDIITGTITSLIQNLDTYESLNGYSHEIISNSMGGDSEQWKFGLVANRRSFLLNVRKYDEGVSENIIFGDRIYYSLPNKFDTFLPDNYITVVRGDAENYVCGIEFADRLLAFKQNSVQIINISSSSPTGWSLESKHKYMGIRNPSAVTRTEFGVAWVNDSGCYFYNGSKIVNLIGDDINNIPSKIDDDEWSDFIGITSTHQSIIGYERHKKQLIVMKDCTGNESDSGDAYLYDFKTASWVKLIDAIPGLLDITTFANAGGGQVTVTSASHGISENATIEISGTTNYNGNFTATNVATNTFEITDTWVSDDGIGNVRIRNAVVSNFVHDWNGDLIIAYENGSNVDFKKWDSDDTTGKSNIELRTKDIDFGSPGTYTKIYKIIMTYKSSVNQTTPLEYSVDGKNSFTDFDQISIDGDSADATLDSSSAWEVATFDHSSNSPLLVQSLQLKFNPASSGTININDINIEYRNLPRRRVQ